MTKHFHSKRIAQIVKKQAGTDHFHVDIPFVPDYIRVDFHDIKHKPDVDTLQWDLVATSPTTYQLTVTYDVHEERDIRYVVAKLPRDPEMTIAHGN